MKTTIDRAGRVVIPKAIRERAGLQPGMEIEISVDNGRVEMTPAGPQGRVVYKDGMPVWEAPPGAPPVTLEETNEWIRILREERDKF